MLPPGLTTPPAPSSSPAPPPTAPTRPSTPSTPTRQHQRLPTGASVAPRASPSTSTTITCTSQASLHGPPQHRPALRPINKHSLAVLRIPTSSASPSSKTAAPLHGHPGRPLSRRPRHHRAATHLNPPHSNKKHSKIAEIIAVGSEMLTPFRQDTKLPLPHRPPQRSRRLRAFQTIVGDNLNQLTTEAARIAIAPRRDRNLLQAASSPTEDDLTRVGSSCSRARRRLHRDETIVTEIYKRYAARKLVMPPNNAKQADILAGAAILENPNGSSPGQ